MRLEGRLVDLKKHSSGDYLLSFINPDGILYAVPFYGPLDEKVLSANPNIVMINFVNKLGFEFWSLVVPSRDGKGGYASTEGTKKFEVWDSYLLY